MCVLIFSTTSDTFLILRRIQRDITKMYIGLHAKVSVFLVRF